MPIAKLSLLPMVARVELEWEVEQQAAVLMTCHAVPYREAYARAEKIVSKRLNDYALS